MRKSILVTALLYLTIVFPLVAKDYDLKSPNEKIQIRISVGNEIGLEAKQEGNLLFSIANIAMHLKNGRVLGAGAIVRKSKIKFHKGLIIPTIKEKMAEIKDIYNELTIDFKGRYTLLVRAYDNGISYRFVTNFKTDITVISEKMRVHFHENDTILFQKSNSPTALFETFPVFFNYEMPYEHQKYNEVSDTTYLSLPYLVASRHGPRILMTESDLDDYPGLFFKMGDANAMSAIHPYHPLELIQESNPYVIGQVKKNTDYIAKTNGSRSFPWRVFVIAENDAELLTNTLVYQLAKPLEIEDPSWIEPGVVTLDWWGRRNIYGTDFEAGVNTATAKYFIDFASEFGFTYFLLDDGWSDKDDLAKLNPELDLEEVIRYAKTKNVKIMLWAIWSAFEKDWEANFDRFENWGIAGIKFDFMNRDDQEMVQFYRRVAKEAAKRKMILDFHGAYKPTGLRRAYPNILTREAMVEFEYNGFSDYVDPTHDNLLPYIRMVTGPMDYIPFTTNNAKKIDFRKNGNKPMGKGTRAHSMAMFVVFESPMAMLADSPSDYYRERECTEFISAIPVEWDEIKVLEAKAGEYTVVSRRNGTEWFIGAITDWESRDFEISYDFLGEGIYNIEFIEDGINAERNAIDYKKGVGEVTAATTTKIHLAKGGGWIARITKKN